MRSVAGSISASQQQLVRLTGTVALVYLCLLAVMIAYGSESWYGTNEVAGIGSEWFAWATLLLGLASLTSIGFLWRGLDPSERNSDLSGSTTPAKRVVLAFVAVLLVAALVMVFPAAHAASKEYDGRSILGIPGDWIGWVAVPLAVNALAIVVFVLWPRISRKAERRP